MARLTTINEPLWTDRHSGIINIKALQKKIAAAVEINIGFTPIVYVVELGFLPRSEKKSKRVIDERFQ